MSLIKPILLIHGGAGTKPAKYKADVDACLGKILSILYSKLRRGLPAHEAAKIAVCMLEDDPLFNAGLGSKIQSDGVIRMSAALMKGENLRFSGVVNVRGVKNPIELAAILNRGEFRVLSERGAEKCARSHGLKFSSPYTDQQRKEFLAQKKKNKFGTVGAVVLDKAGNLAAATSTGGRGYEYPHRVSDTPTVAGNYANQSCAVSVTGVGEQIVDHAVAATICGLVDYGVTMNKAVAYVMRSAKKKKSKFGLIALNKRGQFSVHMTTPHMTWAVQSGVDRISITS